LKGLTGFVAVMQGFNCYYNVRIGKYSLKWLEKFDQALKTAGICLLDMSFSRLYRNKSIFLLE